MLRIGGGDVVRGEASELYPLLLALLELFLLFRPFFCNLVRRIVFISEAWAGEKALPVPHVALPPGVSGPVKGVGALGFWSLWTCGVVKMVSSGSSPPMLASPSLSVLSLSLAIMLTLPTELLTTLLSGANEPQGVLPSPFTPPGESSIMLLTLPFRIGIAIPFCVMTGLESGLLSANVEWCNVEHALAKSRPRECLGRVVAGLALKFW
jgi:hypothetical protein